MTNASRQGDKGPYQLQFLMLRFSKYWRAQRRLPTRVTLGYTNELINMIELNQLWDPPVYHSLAFSLKLGVLGRTGRAQAEVKLKDNAKTQSTTASIRLGIIGLIIGNMSGLYLKTLMVYSEKSKVGE